MHDYIVCVCDTSICCTSDTLYKVPSVHSVYMKSQDAVAISIGKRFLVNVM